MQYAKYGKDGPEVSRLGFGAMRLPLRKENNISKVNFTRTVAIMHQAMQAGLNFIDTAHTYHDGVSEAAIGRALKSWKGHRIYTQTKSPWFHDEPTDYFKKLLVRAVENLGVDAIDYLLCHAVTMDVFKDRGRRFLKLTDWAMNRGLIRNRGFSSHDTPENVKKLIDTGEFSVMLLSYNWYKPEMTDTITYGASKGMGVAIMNPVGGGLLSPTTPEILHLLRGSKSGPETALRYVLATPGVTLALSGMNTAEQVEENTRVAGRKTPMTAKQRRTMVQRLQKIKKRTKNQCTGCGYCTPCPNGVDIPRNFLLLEQAKLFGLIDHAKAKFAKLRQAKNGDKSALACVECGECLPKCPNNVPIIEQLQETAELLAE